ncbi:MAG: 4-hydroxythreonine-4-phosphate dehydrogenase [Pseudomonadota bacterium]|jgi:4-hydroxythreonine-4-phosphate dehydrogenase
MAGRLVLTSGDPGGIGPDLCIALAGCPEAQVLAVAGDPQLLKDRAQRLGVPIKIIEMSDSRAWPEIPPGALRVWPVASAPSHVAGLLTPANAGYVLQTLDAAVRGCLEGAFDAMVTAPISKAVINEAGRPFSGHTEYIAALTGGHPVMLLATPGLRVALATTHLPLAEVPSAIHPEGLEQILRILRGDLTQRFGFSDPHILVAGLNPHAGESGHLGKEEINVITPVLEKLRGEGFRLTGPMAADTLFLPQHLETADAVLAMYHDQGLPVLKYQGFGRAVNITLGLPIIRTSVDHGTAADLAGTGKADAGSLMAAIASAMDLVRTQQPINREDHSA